MKRIGYIDGRRIRYVADGVTKFAIHPWGVIIGGVEGSMSLYLAADYGAYINSWMAGGLELCASTMVRMQVGGKGWSVEANGVCSTAYIIRTTGTMDFGASHTGSLQLPQRITSIARPTEGKLWYDSEQKKLRFATDSAMETVTSS